MQSSFRHQLPRISLIDNRDDFIVARCRDKVVLHVGCIGTEESWRIGSALHGKLLTATRRAIGLDIDAAGIERLRRRGIPDLVECDLEDLNPGMIPTGIDVIVVGEILEHLVNAGRCLERLRGVTLPETVLIVTVPNAFSLRGFASVTMCHSELVRSDHRCYFSYMTLQRVLHDAGFRIDEFYAYSHLREQLSTSKRLLKYILNHTILRASPFAAEGLIAVGRQAGDA